uniref:LBH domain-containing protein n=1 Tax=Seriola dumerili TaxID=41447 RepID=A0A3B4USI6_SERDU
MSCVNKRLWRLPFCLIVLSKRPEPEDDRPDPPSQAGLEQKTKANMNQESDSSSYPDDFLYRRERLPSIVVEPTEHTELESRELHWPPRCLMSNNVEEEEEENSGADHTEGSVDGEQQEHMEG